MRILLVNPNFRYFPGFLENFVGYKSPPLGLAYLAAYVRTKHFVAIEICDAAALNLDEMGVCRKIKEFVPDIIGMTVTTTTVEAVRNICILSRTMYPKVLIVLGGSHVSALPEENLDVADVCVVGEGEATFSDIVMARMNNQDFGGVAGIVYNCHGNYITNNKRTSIVDLDCIPFPARDLLPRYDFRHIYPYRLKNPYYDTLITSRGCVYDCTFCVSKLVWGRTIRYRSLDNVLAEVDELVHKYNRSLLFIRDDNFVLNPERVTEFCRRKRKHFPELKWMCHGRADCLSSELLKEMESSGCLEIQIGVESGDDKILGNCRKDVNLETIRNAFRMLSLTKINSWATFIIGNEGETEETVEKTIEFSKQIDPTYCSFMFLSPLPGSQCFESMFNKGQIKVLDWSRYSWHGEPVFETDLLSRQKLEELRKKAYRSFYLRPSRFYKYFIVMIQSGQFKLVFINALILMKFLIGLIKK